jgi:hypothetical protein
MISRFFKKKDEKKPAKSAPKKTTAEPKASAPKQKTEFQKILTAEGWKRLMMKKYGSGKKK